MKGKCGTTVKKYGAFISLTVALIFIILGLLQGQHNAVLAKAIKICLECIGIG